MRYPALRYRALRCSVPPRAAHGLTALAPRQDCGTLQDLHDRLYSRPINFAGLEETAFWTTGAGAQAVRVALSLGEDASVTLPQLQQYLSTNATTATPTTLHICSMACGPFVYNKNAYEPLQARLPPAA